MSYFLRFDGDTTHVALATNITLGVGETIEYRGVYRTVGQAFNLFISLFTSGAAPDPGGWDFIAFDAANLLSIRVDNTITTGSTALTPGAAFVFTVERTTTEYIFLLNGVEEVRLTKSTTLDPFRGFGTDADLADPNSVGASCDLYFARRYNSGGNINVWNPTGSGGTGTTLTDSVGANNGTLVNFAGTYWINYSYAVIALAGQSNMLGSSAIVPGVDDDYSGLDSTWQYGYNAQAILAAKNTLDHVNEVAGDGGSWRKFATDIIAEGRFNGRPILFVPVAEGGTGFLRNNWNQGDPLYTSAVSRINAAMALDAGNTFEGVLWMQGEADAMDDTTTYLANVQAMYDAMIIDITGMTVDTPFITSQMLYPSEPNAPAVNADIATFASNNASVYLVSTSDLATTDGVHLDSPSLNTVGTRQAAGFAALNPIGNTYTLEWRLVAGPGATTSVTGINELFYDLSGLTASTDYEFRVLETDGTTPSAFSAWITVATAAAVTYVDIAAAAAGVLSTTGSVANTKSVAGSATATLSTTGVASTIKSIAAASSSALSTTGAAAVTKSVSGTATATLTTTGATGGDKTASGASTSALSATGTASTVKSVASSATVVLSTSGDTSKLLTAAGTATVALTTSGAGSKIISVAADASATLTTSGSAFGGAASDASGAAAATLTASGAAVADRAAAANTSSTLSAAGTAAVTKNVGGSASATASAQASASVIRSVFADAFATLSAAGAAVSGLTSDSSGSASSTLLVSGTAAKTVSVSANAFAVLVASATASNIKDAVAAGFAQLIAQGSAEGGTSVQPRSLYANEVSISPALSCYTAVIPALYGDGAIRPR
jgi:hypothetical protein